MFYKKDESHRNNNSLWLEMFGYRFTDHESLLNNQKSVQLIDVRTVTNDKKPKRIYLVKSYNKLSILRYVLRSKFLYMNLNYIE